MTPTGSTTVPLTVGPDGFLRAGRPHRIVSAAIHYFRVHPALWTDRLTRLRAMGVNTVETYVAWNFHEQHPGEFRFDGGRDVAAFVRAAGALGLDVIVRPGPYICAEWDLGGLPAWLLADRTVRLRRRDPRYLAAVDAWFDELLPRLVPLLAGHGGPVVAMGVENEYGSFGNDTSHLEYLRDGMTARGVDCPLFTSDGAGDGFLLGGRVPGLLAAATFGSRPEESLAVLRAHQPTGPLFCVEYWHGWFDHWGESHHVRDAAESADVLDRLLRAGASVNIYMGHGGTNFGWWAGANHDGRSHQPDTTSYDYGAPVGEAGELTEKFRLFRDVIVRHTGAAPDAAPEPPPRLAPLRVPVRERVSLAESLDLLSTPVPSAEPLTMEEAGQAHGLIHYRTRLRGPLTHADLTIDGLGDRAQVFLDGREIGVLHRDRPRDTLPVRVTGASAVLDVLVENQGRINYGPLLEDRKGIVGGLRLDNQYQFGWENRPLPLDDLSALRFTDTAADGPAFHRATVTVPGPADGFLALPGWTKGMVWLNGEALGRYWNIGPQRTLYAPGPLWHTGDNEIVILELHQAGTELEISAAPDLGPSAPAPVPA
ncbi:beta-galactosidase [Streptomyces sp. NPDC008150]|uniref:glycoside hydrolase family 35 protein n=1 Tax=Streptomyces sp. NPDC008150 TaxID=3364816 RepID=UPI0036EFC0C3